MERIYSKTGQKFIKTYSVQLSILYIAILAPILKGYPVVVFLVNHKEEYAAHY